LKKAGVDVTATWLDKDHSPYLSAAEEVAQLVEEAMG